MVKRRSHRSDEIMLIPFLDILCSLIGVLVLIIVVLVVAQTQKINGRTQEELVRAQSHQKLLKQQKENERINALLGGKVSMLETLREQAKAKEQEVAKLRMLINNSAANKQLSQNLLKELDNLLLEISGLTAHEVALKKEIEELMAEIKKRGLLCRGHLRQVNFLLGREDQRDRERSARSDRGGFRVQFISQGCRCPAADQTYIPAARRRHGRI